MTQSTKLLDDPVRRRAGYENVFRDNTDYAPGKRPLRIFLRPMNGYSIIVAINVGRIHNSRAAVVVDSADSLYVRAEKRPNQSTTESRDECHLHSRR
jgi:hypothetical protein